MKKSICIKKLLFLLFLASLGVPAFTQYVYTIKADSVKVTNCDSAELIIENHTQGVPGFLFNTGNGRTIFKKAVQKINDSFYLIGADTVKIQPAPLLAASNGLSTSGNMVQLGQTIGQAGNPAAFTSSREIPLNGDSIVYSDAGGQLALDFQGWLSSPRLLSNNFITIGSASNFVSIAGTTNVTSANDFPVLQLITGSLGNSFDMNFSSVIESFVASGSVGHNQPLLITTSANTVNPYVAGDIIISPGRVQTQNFANQISTPYNIDLQPSGTGGVAIGNITPSARLHITAGTATAGTAPLKLTAGTLLSAPEDGAVEYDGANYYAGAGSTRYTLSKTLTTTATLNFPSTGAQSSSDLTVTLSGVALGDVVAIGPDNASVVANSCYSAWVSSTNTVTIRFNNYSTATLDPASGSFRISVIKY